MKPCKDCGKQIGSDVARCPHCGAVYTTRLTWWIAGAILFILALMVLAATR